MMPANLSVVMRRWSFVRETDGPNRGYWVEFIQRFTGNEPGDSWCCSLVSLCEDVAYRGKAPSRKTASCMEKLTDCRTKGYVVTTPLPDDLCFSVDATGHAHHIGVVTAIDPLKTIAGNTSEDGLSSNGDGVYEHTVNSTGKIFVRLPQ